MKLCPFDSSHGKFTNAGLSVHIAKIHKEELQAQLRLCPHPFCGKSLPPDQMRAHWEEEHDTWRLHDGRFVWEVLDDKAVEAVEKKPPKELEQGGTAQSS